MLDQGLTRSELYELLDYETHIAFDQLVLTFDLGGT